VDSAQTYDELVDIARRDDNIVGLVLTGSRGKGFAVTDDSDWDVRLVVRDEVLDEYRSRFATSHGSAVDVVVFSLSGCAAEIPLRGS
jgi:predicted nucleotidyltransferase